MSGRKKQNRINNITINFWSTIMPTKDKITDFISASADEKPVAAYNAFASAVEDKVQDLLSQKQDEIRSSMFTSEGESE